MAENINNLSELPLNDADRQKIFVLAQSIDPSDASLVLHYGTSVQRKLASVSDKMLAVSTEKPTFGIAETVNALADEIRPLSDVPSKKGFFARLFRKRAAKRLRKRYNETAVTVERLTVELENHRNTLLRDHVLLGKLQEAVLEQYKELTVYTEAGRQRLADITEQSERGRFEKRLYDLELSRTVSMQMLPQIGLLREANLALSEKIQSLLTNTVPLWKNQMSLALGMENAQGVNNEMIGMLNGVLREQEEHDRKQTELEHTMKEFENEG
jgi:uncharacterized protein YaaN involved in tellurite resistance